MKISYFTLRSNAIDIFCWSQSFIYLIEPVNAAHLAGRSSGPGEKT